MAEDKGQASEDNSTRMLKHVRADGYRTLAVSGAVISASTNDTSRFELSFFIDRPYFREELLEEIGRSEDSVEYRPTGKIKTEHRREHLVAINLAESELESLGKLIERTLHPEDAKESRGSK